MDLKPPLHLLLKAAQVVQPLRKMQEIQVEIAVKKRVDPQVREQSMVAKAIKVVEVALAD